MTDKEYFTNVTKIKCHNYKTGESASWCDLYHKIDTLEGEEQTYHHFDKGLVEVVAFADTVRLSVYQVPPNSNVSILTQYFAPNTRCIITDAGFLKCYNKDDPEYEKLP